MNPRKYLSSLTPIIIVGMHRSGTTLITKFLREFGGFFGWNCDHNEEALFFLNRNEAIIKSNGVFWTDIRSIQNINRQGLINNYNGPLTSDLLTLPILEYLGPINYMNFYLKRDFPIIWGWKDPRNVLLLPLWLDIFPNAKIIHVFRNGVDVAHSLLIRERLRREDKNKKLNKTIRKKRSPISHKRIRKFINKHIIDSAGFYIVRNKYKQNPKAYISSVNTLEDGFEIWHQYLDIVSNLEKQNRIDKMMEICYESFLNSPLEFGQKLLQFTGLNHTSNQIKDYTIKINSSRAYAFLKDKELVQFYRVKKDSKYMVQYNYNDLV